jgi:hypothetical protein
MKIENGKKMELDTVLTGDDVFVWNGDTLNPVKHIKKFNPSGFDKMHHFDVEVENNDGQENVRIYKHKGGKAGEPMIYKMESGGNMEVFTDEEGDSVQKRIILRKRLKDGTDEDNFIYLNGPNGMHFPPVPPVPPMPPMPPHMKIMKGPNAGRVIDLNDPNIISYKKKNLSGDREKIEIIRKKSEGSENMSFDFEVPEPPMAPEPPVNRNEYNKDQQGKKMIKKEMKEEVESEENK